MCSLLFSLYIQNGDLGGMVERRRVSDGTAGSASGEIFRDRDKLPDFEVAILAKRLEGLHVFASADVDRVVDGDQNAAIVDQRADLVYEAGAVLFLVHFAS